MGLGIGSWRFFLAFLVVISHLWKDMIGGPAAYAVWGFYVLSGYLMTLVLNEKYGPSINGLKRYAYNRFLRIYPLYWAASALGLLALLILPSLGIVASTLNPAFNIPYSLADYWHNLTLIPIFGGQNLLTPVSGALATEIGAYILMPFVAFSRLAAILGLILSLIANVKLGLTIDDFAMNFATRYSSFLSCYIAFTFGSLTYHLRNHLAKLQLPLLSVIIWIIHSFLGVKFNLYPWLYGLYTSIPLSAWVAVSLLKMNTGKLDRILGDLSYPVYLFHSGVAVWFLFYFNNVHSFSFFIVSFLVTILISTLLLQIDRKILMHKH
jgi:peptidoglycan/LPS O-acetylase OafA/YrhL